MRWQYKYLVQKALSCLPLGAGIRLNDAISGVMGRRRVPGFLAFASGLAAAALFEKYDGRLEGKQCIELGTGWDGAAPLLMLSLGAAGVHSFDRYRFLRQSLVSQAQERIRQLAPFTAAFPWLEADVVAVASHARGQRIDLSRFFYYAPADFCASGLPPDTADLFFSLAVLPYVEERRLLPIHREAMRLLKPGGLSIHYPAAYHGGR